MNLTIGEFKELLSLVDTGKVIPIQIERNTISLTIKVKTTDVEGKLLKPIQIQNTVIKELGIYDIDGIKFWIIKQ